MNKVTLQNLKGISVSAVTVFVLSACGSDKDASSTKATFGAPSLATIVEAAAPKGLTGATSSVSLMSLEHSDYFGAIASDCSTYTSSPADAYLFDKFVSFMKCASFRENKNFAGPTYYRYWVDKVDEQLASIDARFSAAENPPACLSSTAVEKTFEFTLDHASAGSSPETVKYAMKFNCYESNTSSGYNMAFGKDENYYYVANLTTITSSNAKIFVLAKASIDSKEVDLWFLGTSTQSGSGVPSWANSLTAVANRVIANKETGAFTYALAEIPLGMAQQSNFMRSNGKVLYFKAQSSNGSSITDVVNGTTKEFCLDSTTLEASTDATACTTATLDKVPDNFGITTALRSGDTEFYTELKADIETISKTDFSALGVKSTTESSAAE